MIRFSAEASGEVGFHITMRGAFVWLVAIGLVAPSAAFACPGDCDGDQDVAVAEVVTGVRIALGTSELSACASLDRDDSESITIDENLVAIMASLMGCPETPTPTVTPTATPTPSATVNLPPALVCTDVYKAFPEQPIAFPIPVSDPDGGQLRFLSDSLPGRAELEEATGILRWTPRLGDVGAYYFPYTVEDVSETPISLAGQLAVQVMPLDDCTIPVCDPATGCVGQLLPLDEPCCRRLSQRLGEPVVSCPGSAAVYVGRNRVSGFGRIQNCDVARVTNFAQTGAVMLLSFEAACIDTSHLFELHVRVEIATRLLFDQTSFLQFPEADADGYARVYEVPFEVLGPGPFFEFEGAEALITVTLTDDVTKTVLRHQVRPRLTFDVLSDVTDPAPIQPLITPDPCLTPTSGPSPTHTPSPTRTSSPVASATATATEAVTTTETLAPTATDTPTAIPTTTATATETATVG